MQAAMADPDPSTKPTPHTRLPADLSRLRDRFLAEHPNESATVRLLEPVPAALRHMLGLRLDLDQADQLPRRYRDLAAGIATQSSGTPPDPVEEMVQAFVSADTAERAALLGRLEAYFTRPQLTELLLIAALRRALADVSAVIG